MADETTHVDPTKGNSTNTTDPSESGEGHSTQDDLPERFKGKTANEIANQYLDLQKKLGEQANELGTTRQQLQKWNEFDQWLTQSEPEVVALIAKKARAMSQVPNQNQTQTQTQVNPEINRMRAEVSDTRLVQQQGIIEKFESKYGINQLEGEAKADLQKRIGQEIKEMRAPGGDKPLANIIAETPLQVLGSVFEKAYRLATDDDAQEKSRVKGMVDAQRNNQAAFSSLPSRSIREDTTTLTADERKVANKLGIGEKRYLESKKKIAEEYS